MVPEEMAQRAEVLMVLAGAAVQTALLPGGMRPLAVVAVAGALTTQIRRWAEHLFTAAVAEAAVTAPALVVFLNLAATVELVGQREVVQEQQEQPLAVVAGALMARSLRAPELMVALKFIRGVEP